MKINISHVIGFLLGVSTLSLCIGFWDHFSNRTADFAATWAISLGLAVIVGLMTWINE